MGLGDWLRFGLAVVSISRFAFRFLRWSRKTCRPGSASTRAPRASRSGATGARTLPPFESRRRVRNSPLDCSFFLFATMKNKKGPTFVEPFFIFLWSGRRDTGKSGN